MGEAEYMLPVSLMNDRNREVFILVDRRNDYVADFNQARDDRECQRIVELINTNDAALRRAKAEGRIKSMWEAVHIANTYNCDHNHGKKATEAVDNVLLKLYDRIAELEADARAAQIEEGE
jgi:hypothetical protein